MANDGKVVLGTEIDTAGISSGLKRLAATVVSSVALKEAFSYVSKVGMDFEAGMSEVAAISGATGDELAALTDKAKEMGIQTKFSATEASEAMKYMAMAGWKTEDMLNGISGVMNLAAASGENLGTVSDIVTDALTAFGLSAKDSGRFADVLAAASSNANTNVALMGETFKYVAPLAGTLEYSVEDMSVAIGLMANAGIKGSQAGTSLRAILSRMSKPTKEVSDAMNALGVNMYDANGKARPLNDVMVDLRSALDESKIATGELTKEQRTNYITAIAGQEAMSGLAAIVNASEADFNKLTAAVAGADGTAQKMADTMNDNLKGQLTLLGSSCEGLGLAIYDGIQEPLKEAAKWAIEAVNDMTKSFQSGKLKGALQSVGKLIGDLVKVIMQIAKAVIPVLVKALAWVGDNLKWLLPLVTAVVTAFTAYKTIGKIVNSAFGVIIKNLIESVTRFGLATTAALIYEEALVSLKSVTSALTSPVGLLAAGLGILAGIVVACCTSTNESTQAFREQKAALEEAKAATDEATESFNQLKEKQAEQIAETESQYAHTQSLWEELKGLADANGVIKEQDAERAKVLAELLNPTLGETIQLNKDGTVTLIEEADAIDKLLEKKRAEAILAAKEPAYKEAIANSMAVLTKQRELDAAMSARQLEIDTLTAQAQKALAEGNTELAGKIGARVAQEVELMQMEQEEYNANKELLKGYYEAISDYEGTLTAIQQGNYDTRTGLRKSEVDSANATTAEMEKAYEERIGIEQEKYDTMLEQAQEKNSAITEAELDAQRKRIENEKAAMLQMYLATLAGGKDLTAASSANAKSILSAYSYLPDEQKQIAVKAMLEQAKGIEEKIPALKYASKMSADEIISAIMTHLSNNENAVYRQSAEIGEKMVFGSQDIINKKKVGVISAAKSMVAEAIKQMRAAAEIHSPSKKTAEVGRYLVEGLSKGVNDNEVIAVRSATSTVQDMIERMQATVSAETSSIGNRMSVGEQRRLAFAQPAGYGAPTGWTIDQTLHNSTELTVELDGDVLARKVDDRTRINRLRKGR